MSQNVILTKMSYYSEHSALAALQFIKFLTKIIIVKWLKIRSPINLVNGTLNMIQITDLFLFSATLHLRHLSLINFKIYKVFVV